MIRCNLRKTLKLIHMEIKLKYAKFFPEVWSGLSRVERDGWVKRKVENPETDQEHTIACMELVLEMKDELLDFFELKLRNTYNFFESYIQDQLDQLETHEYPEWKEGDKPDVVYDEEEKKRLKALKFEREYNTMVEIRDAHGDKGKEVFDLWLRFEKKENGENSFARQIDWYQSIVKAWEYQQEGKKVLAQDFIDYYRKDITHPLIVRKILNIENLAKNTQA